MIPFSVITLFPLSRTAQGMRPPPMLSFPRCVATGIWSSHRAIAAFRAISERCSGVSDSDRAMPPFALPVASSFMLASPFRDACNLPHTKPNASMERKCLHLLNRSRMMVSMNRLPRNKQIQVVASLVEGNSIRATVRMTGVAKNTVIKLLVDIGAACEAYQVEKLVNLPCKRIQCDEIWSFVGAKQKQVNQGAHGVGDVWTWTAICADTKLVPSWLVGDRGLDTAKRFVSDLAGRLASRVQVTSDGHKCYVDAVEGAFGSEVDFAQLVKQYGNEQRECSEVRYSPAVCTGAKKIQITGTPNPAHISTSYVERQNLTMRMSIRRFTRLTNAFSKKVENHCAAVALHFMHYNFCRIHQTLRVTPAMAAGVTDHVWEIGEIVDLLK